MMVHDMSVAFNYGQQLYEEEKNSQNKTKQTNSRCVCVHINQHVFACVNILSLR